MEKKSTALDAYQFSMLRVSLVLSAVAVTFQFFADYFGLVQATLLTKLGTLAFATILVGLWVGLVRKWIGSNAVFITAIFAFYIHEIVTVPERTEDQLTPMWFTILIGAAYVYGSITWGLIMTLLSILGFFYVVTVSPHMAVTTEEYVTGFLALVCTSGIFFIVRKETTDLINRLDILSELDPLTKLLNRRALEARYSAIQESAGFDKQQLCLALVDIDNFKAINDSLGHASGDEVISGLSDVLKSSFRVSDLIARIGGDEFVVVALDCEAASASKLFETAQQRFENLVLRTDASDGNVTPSLSIGLLEYRGGEVSLREALKSADSLLYQAKQQGKKRIVAQDYFSVP